MQSGLQTCNSNSIKPAISYALLNVPYLGIQPNPLRQTTDSEPKRKSLKSKEDEQNQRARRGRCFNVWLDNGLPILGLIRDMLD